MKTAAAYIRVSTDEQAEYSPDSQLKAIREYARRNDIILLDEFIFTDEGISGRKAEKRPEFMRMIGTAKTRPRPFDVILLWKFSRFARNREDSIVYKSMLRKQYGIEVISVSEQLGDDKISILIEALIEAMDEYYSINLAEEVRRGMTEKAQRGEVVSAPPFGYRVKDNVFVPDPDTAPVVRLIFKKYLNGQGCLDIAKDLNAMGLRTRQGSSWENRGVSYILKNIVYTGMLRWTPVKADSKTIVAQGKHEPLIKADDFDKVQNIMNKNKCRFPERSAAHCSEFMLKGLLKCSSCGGSLVCSSGKRVQCSRYSKGKCSVSHSTALDKLNSSVVNAVKNDIINSTFEIKGNTDKNDDEMIQFLIQKELKKLDRIKAAYKAGIDSLDEYKTGKLEISDNISRLKKISRNTAAKPSGSSIHLDMSVLDNPDFSERIKNIILRSFIKQIVYNKENKTICIFYQVY